MPLLFMFLSCVSLSPNKEKQLERTYLELSEETNKNPWYNKQSLASEEQEYFKETNSWHKERHILIQTAQAKTTSCTKRDLVDTNVSRTIP